MIIRNLALTGLIGLGLGSVALYTPPAEARAYYSVSIRTAPPAPRYERVVVRPGYAWSPGYWRWDGHRHRHVWIGGYYVQHRPGYRWQPPHWERHGHRWGWRGGHWRR